MYLFANLFGSRNAKYELDGNIAPLLSLAVSVAVLSRSCTRESVLYEHSRSTSRLISNRVWGCKGRFCLSLNSLLTVRPKHSPEVSSGAFCIDRPWLSQVISRSFLKWSSKTNMMTQWNRLLQVSQVKCQVAKRRSLSDLPSPTLFLL